MGAIRIPVAEIGSEIAASTAMAAALWTALPYLPRTLVVTIAAVFAGAAIYGALILALSGRIRAKVVRVVDM